MNVARSRGGRGRRLGGLLLAAAAGVAVTACSPGVNVRGNLADAEAVAAIEPGVHGREDVIDMLGSPSAVSTFEDSNWYYIGSKTTQFAFFKPEILERSVLVVSFADGGVVAGTKLYTLADGRAVDPVDRRTPTEGTDLTILQQLFGNIGRFSTEEPQRGNPAEP